MPVDVAELQAAADAAAKAADKAESDLIKLAENASAANAALKMGRSAAFTASGLAHKLRVEADGAARLAGSMPAPAPVKKASKKKAGKKSSSKKANK
jgi:hypothetical protein